MQIYNLSRISSKLWYDIWEESKNKNAKLMFSNVLWTSNLGFRLFQLTNFVHNLTLSIIPYFGSLAIFNFTLFKKWKTTCVLKFKAKFKCKESYEKVIYAPHDNKPWGFQCKWYDVTQKVLTKLFDLIRFHHFVFLVPSSPILSLLVLVLLI